MRFSLNDFNRYIHSAGVSFGQMTVLLHLHYQGACEISRFCDLMQITPAGASQMIERLVQMGLVRRAEVPGDRRVRMVDLSDLGQEIVQQSIIERQAWVSNLVKMLSEAEREQVYGAMHALNRHAETLRLEPVSLNDLPHPNMEA